MTERLTYDWDIPVTAITKGQLTDRSETNDATERVELPSAASGTIVATPAEVKLWQDAQATIDVEAWRLAYVSSGYDRYEFSSRVCHEGRPVSVVPIGQLVMQNY